MNEEQIDELVYEALARGAGQRFHQWLVNNYLLAIKATSDPHEALYQNAQQTLVAALNTRFARHVERCKKDDEWGKDHDRGEAEKPPRLRRRYPEA